MRAELIFRGAQQEYAHNPNEISSFAPELVFREVPGSRRFKHLRVREDSGVASLHRSDRPTSVSPPKKGDLPTPSPRCMV